MINVSVEYTAGRAAGQDASARITLLAVGWRLDPVHATFSRGHNVGFRIKKALPDESRDDSSGTHPAGDRCPATFRVRNNDRIGRLRLRRGSYRITVLGDVDCGAAAQLFAQFLQRPAGNLPRPWVIDAAAGAFLRGRRGDDGFRVKPVRFRPPAGGTRLPG